MNKTNFNQTGGFPLKTERLQELETAYSIFNSLGFLAGDLTIISGCKVEGNVIKDGVVFIDGEIYDFRESFFESDSKVIIIEEKIERPFENGTVKTVHIKRYATIGTSETSWLWSSFTRLIETKTLKAYHDTVDNRLAEIETKLETIEEGAQVNVQSDWNENNNASAAFIKNKLVLSSPFLRIGSFNIGDPSTDQKYTISFPDVGTASYIVLGAIRVNVPTQWNLSNDVIWTYGGPTRTQFDLHIREIAAQVQDISFVYVLIPV